MTFLDRSDYVRQARRFSRNARLFLASQAIAGIGSGIYSLLFNLYLVRLGFHEDFVGQVSGAMTLATGLVAFPAGLIADRIGRRRSMLIGGIVVPVAYLVQTVVAQPNLILLASVIVGAGMALLAVSFSPFMSENSSSEERPYLFSSGFAVMMLSGMVGNLAGGVLPRLFAGLFSRLPDAPEPYRMALLLAVAFFATAAAPFFLMREEQHEEAHAEAPRSDVSFARADVMQRFAIYAVLNILVGIAGGVILPFFNVYFHSRFSMPDAHVGLVFAVSQALSGVGMLLAPRLSRRTGSVPAITTGYFLAVPFLAILAMTGNPWLAATAYWGRNVAMNVINPIAGAFAMDLIPARLRATFSGINNMAWNSTWAIGSAIGGALILSWGYGRVFVLSAVFYAITGCVFLLAFRQYRQA